MRAGDPTKHPAHRAVFAGAENQVPVIRHPLVREKFHIVPLQTLAQNALEGFVIAVFMEDAGAGIASIKGMIKSTGLVRSFGSRYLRSLTRGRTLINVLTPFPFVTPFPSELDWSP